MGNGNEPLMGCDSRAGGAGAPEHQRSEAASRRRVPSPRVVSCPTCGASQMGFAEIFA